MRHVFVLFAGIFAFSAGCVSVSTPPGGTGSTGHGGSSTTGTGAGTTTVAPVSCDSVCAKQMACPGGPTAAQCQGTCAGFSDACRSCLLTTCDLGQCVAACTGTSSSSSSSSSSGVFTPEDCSAGGQPCNFDSDCPSGQKCNGKADHCFDPDPIDLDVKDCSQTPCLFDVDCPQGYGCNTATDLCFKK